MADVHRVHAGLIGHEQGQPVAEVDEVHPLLQSGCSGRGDRFYGGAGVAEEGLAQPHSLGGAGVVLRRVEEQGGDGRIPTFPTDQLIVVHLREDMVVAEPLGVLVELLAPPDEHRLEGGVPVEHGALVREQIGPAVGEGLNGGGFRSKQVGGGGDIGEDIGGIGWRMAECGEMMQQSGDRPAELRAGRVASGNGQARPTMLLGQGAEFSA